MKKYKNKEWLNQKYTIEKLSTYRIAQLCNVNNVTIFQWLKRFNIKRRDKGKAVALYYSKGIEQIFEYRNYKWLNQKYVLEKYSIPDIAKLCNIGTTTIKTWLEKLRIKIRTKREGMKIYYSRHQGIRSGNTNANWKGGAYKSGGYLITHQPNHPHATKDGYVPKHRLVMEKKLSRYLEPGEIVHHIDGDKLNNDELNLFLTDKTEHRKAHFSLMKVGYELCKQGIIKFKNGEYFPS